MTLFSSPSSSPSIPPRLVLLPGLDGTGKLFAKFVEALGARVETFIVAYPTGEPLGYEALEARVRAVLPPTQPFVLLGESFSGPIALRIAAQPPAGMRGVILCGTFARRPLPWLAWAAPVVAWVPLKRLPRWVRALVMWGSTRASRAPARADRGLTAVASPVIRRRVRELLVVDATAALRRVTLPLLILHGRRDRVISRRSAEWMIANAAACEVVEIDGPHLLLQAEATQCAAAVESFLGRC